MLKTFLFAIFSTYPTLQIFVLSVTMIREAVDDFRRFRRDREVNNKKYKKLTKRGLVDVISAKIQVGDLILVNKVCKWVENDNDNDNTFIEHKYRLQIRIYI